MRIRIINYDFPTNNFAHRYSRDKYGPYDVADGKWTSELTLQFKGINQWAGQELYLRKCWAI